jgi:LmbE family N-acetylglucosaminyl deacetylase
LNILAIGAHPDDIEFGCAAVLILEAAAGNSVKLRVLSRGEAGSHGTPEVRELETRAAAAIIGGEVEFLDFGGDCHIEYSPANVIRIAREIRASQPDIVLAPHPSENQHPDHATAARLIRDACRFARYGGLSELTDLSPHRVGSLLFYNITKHLSEAPDFVIDVSGAVDRWESAMSCHASQVGSRGYIEMQKTAAHVLGLASGTQYAIGLFANDPVIVSGLGDLSRSARTY